MYKRLKTTLSLLLFFLPAAMHGHTLPHEYPDTLTVAAPDMAAIKKSVADIGSPYYFPVLMSIIQTEIYEEGELSYDF